MDLGLYNLKYPARKLIGGVLPALRRVDPNAISWALLPVGAATAAALFVAAQGRTGLYGAVIGLIVLRMFLGTLDGLVAVHYGKSTPLGELVNRLAPELCDAMYMAALVLARPDQRQLGCLALAMAWLTSFSGLLGAVIGRPTQSVGPVGQTDRLAALIACSLLALASRALGWRIDAMRVFLCWAAAGGAATVCLRLSRHLRDARRL